MQQIPGFLSRHRYSVSLTLVVLWLGYWLFMSRYALLDDALIHLHYADMLRLHHFITFDGVHHGFGTSSLLYVALLAILGELFRSPLLPKIVSEVAYCGLLATIFSLVFKFRKNHMAQALMIGLSLCVISPMAVRWSTDGMETSLTNLAIVLLVLLTKHEQESPARSKSQVTLLVFFGAAIVCLRIELALIAVLSSLSIFIANISSDRSRWKSFLEAAPLAAGAGLALLSIRIVMGHFLPDTALAKSGQSLSIGPLISTLKVLASSFLFGAGIAFIWVLSMIILLRRIIQQHSNSRRILILVLVENSAFPIMLGLSCLRGQAVQGVRYVLWPLLYVIVANAWRMPKATQADSHRPAFDRVERRLISVFLLLGIFMFPLDCYFAFHAMSGRSKTFIEMRSAKLAHLFEGKTIVAGDVGFITYFTNGRTCDIDGLVDGRKMAALSSSQRLNICAHDSPAMMFLTSNQARVVSRLVNLNSWDICGIYDFTNVTHNDRHYLIVPSSSAQKVCHALQFSPTPLDRIVTLGS